ncbi:MAG: ATP-binding protein [Bdellovibrionales bacterium]|nr:ATP-binding protein [Bdellovibrionales bacterium]
MINRKLDLRSINESLFLWGPRQTGKTSLLKTQFPAATYIDLLKSDEFVQYSKKPSLLREHVEYKKPDKLIIDEIQKVPPLLDEVHWLIENTNTQFILCGSSARKLKQGHANLLGGRAFRRTLRGLTAHELEEEFKLETALNHGYLPKIYLSKNPDEYLRAYVTDYLKEEISAEGLVRNLPSFSEFLDLASLSDTEMISYSSFARDVGVSQPTIKSYFQILIDTMIGEFLPAFIKKPKRRVIQAPKFYFFDVGVVRKLTKRGWVEPGNELFGKAFENWVFHELCCYRDYLNPDLEISYWKLPSGIEVDFILNNMEVAIEVKGRDNINSSHLKGLKEVIKDHKKIKRRILVCLENKPRKTEDGIEILPYTEFLHLLWNRKII